MDTRTLTILEYDKIIHDLAGLAHSAPGRELCNALRPSSVMAEVLSRQAETDDAVHLILEKGVLPLGGISEIRPSVARSRSEAVLSCPELLRIAAFLRAVERLRAQLPADGPGERIVYGLIAQLRPARALLTRLDECIAGEEELYDRATPQLFNIRRRIRDAQADVKESLNRIVRNQARVLQDQVVTLRGDRYVVPVKAEHRGDLPGIVHDTSSSGATLFVEPLPVVELNNRIRELMGLEREEIERILIELSGLVSDQADLLIADAGLLADLDFVMAKGRLALQQKAMPPQLNDNGQIRLKAARHPLIPKERVVPIDFELGRAFRSLVITGPNTGGKTVSLKTCGLFCLMAMAGLQIPAREGSEVSLFDQVLADIGDEQSIEQDLSTFSSHMRNIIQITRLARPRTLILVDELGSGTDPSEGAALAIAILEYLRQQGCLTVATTHYKELKGYALHTPGVENACCEFDTDTLRPTFRLLIGVPGVSNAFAISRRLGLSELIISQAHTLLSEEGLRFEELLQSIEKRQVEAEQMRADIARLHAQARLEAEHLEAEQAAWRLKGKEMVQKAREEARELYAQAQLEIEGLLQEIRQQMKEQDATQRHALATQARQKIRAGLGQIEGQIGRDTLAVRGQPLNPSQILVGQTYYAPALGLLGRVIDGPDNRGNCLLQSGSMKVSVPVESLRHPDDAATQPASAAPRSRKQARREDSLTMQRKMTMSAEIQLLGQTVEEALSNLDKYLDDAVLTGISAVRIVHGKGTGALRAAVQQMLRKDPRVRSFRLGAYGEGDSGVTLAELK